VVATGETLVYSLLFIHGYDCQAALCVHDEINTAAMQAQMTPCMPKPVALVSMRGRCNVTMPAAITR